MKHPVPIGIDNFEKMIANGYYYVDKSLLIKELLDNKGETNLFTRPRRFGKTIALSMLKCFFEKAYDDHGREKDQQSLFSGLKIMEAGKAYTDQMSRYPVINLTLKSAKQPDFEIACSSLFEEISREYRRMRYILEGDCLLDSEKKRYEAIMNMEADYVEYAKSLAFLSECLTKYHREKTIILIDEYDVPLENAWLCGFYDQMISFIRSLFESALKSNDYLEFSVITGCLRISKESIFTGLNNLKINTINDVGYGEYFGFTQAEVEQLLSYYQREEKIQEAKEWYDGYLFGKTEVYNPWSIINYAYTVKEDQEAFPKPYWANTSANSIVRELVENSDAAVKKEIEDLIEGGSIEKPVHEEITYEDVHASQDNLWNFLFFTGYLKKTGERFADRTIFLTLKIPNEEVKYIYENTIRQWFEEKLKKTQLTPLFQAVREGDCSTFETFVSDQLLETISIYDYAENYYHGFLAGLLKGDAKFITTSNRESGTGRPDLIYRSPSIRGMAVILELKVVKDVGQMESACDAALKQIEERNYEASLRKEGYSRILKYGVCFYRKECMVKMEKG